MNITELLDLARKATKTDSDRQLAPKIGKTPAAVSTWRKGKAIPEPEVVHKLCELAGIEPRDHIIQNMIDHAKSEELRTTLRKFLATAASIATLILPMVGSPAKANINDSKFTENIHYAHIKTGPGDRALEFFITTIETPHGPPGP